jgi:DNA polymerase-3 subunit epsilon
MYAILDIETTGGNSTSEKITEIAVYIHDGKKIVDEFSTLINPERSVPWFISQLTGINNEMVQDAPKFYEVAKKIVDITSGKTVVAHNAQFDYSFIRQEFKSLGYNFSRDCLCTVKLSRKIIPGFRSYSLGNLCSNLGINIENRHRAGGDALATVKLFELLLERDHDNQVSKMVRNGDVSYKLPEHLDRKIIDALPEAAGVYYFHDQHGDVIYLGKSNNIRKRVLNHLSVKANPKSLELRNDVRDITFELTGNELIAHLLELDELTKHQPVYNRSRGRSQLKYGIFQSVSQDGYILLQPKKITADQPSIATATLAEINELLESKIKKFRLCHKLCGNNDIRYACFNYSIHQCNGACIGKQDPEDYNRRVMEALADGDFAHPNFFIIGKGTKQEEQTVVCVENGKYSGYGFFNPEYISTSEEIREAVSMKADNATAQHIIRRYLKLNKGVKCLKF